MLQKKHNMTKRLVLLRKKKYNRLVKHSLCTPIIEIRKREHNSIIVEEKLIFIYNSGFAVSKSYIKVTVFALVCEKWISS